MLTLLEPKMLLYPLGQIAVSRVCRASIIALVGERQVDVPNAAPLLTPGRQ